MSGWRLKRLNFGVRVGLSAFVLLLGVGQAAGVKHMLTHYDKRDDRPGFTRDDITSAYRGLEAPSPLLAALSRGHPEGLKESDRKVLEAWLTSGKIEQDYENPDLGDLSPREILAASCVQCHSAKVDPVRLAAAKGLALDTAADVKKVAFGRKVLRTPPEKVVVSIHAHAPSMALMGMAALLLAAFSRWPGFIVGGLGMLCGVGLIGDFAGMWFARANEAWINVLLIGGGAFHGSLALLLAMVLADLWLPGGRGSTTCGCGCGKKKQS